ncbi:MAG: FAD-dependent oxidoreductase [Clostridia bacterium]|nr:FAD-dependent oxidoreductase [Clostridia bacterium]
MHKTRFLILGAGPAGLTFANRLLDAGITDFLVLEKETEAGGLCRDTIVDGAPLDVGGGHFLDVRNETVDDYLFRFMPREEWDLFERDSRIRFAGQEIFHPFEANIWQLPQDMQQAYLDSIAAAGCNTGEPMPEKFIDWITWKLGERIAADYMLPYNRKMFADDLDMLGTYWLDKLPNVSFEDTLRSCREKHAYGKQPGHAQFFYPKKYGYGELWRRMAARLGDRILYETPVESFDIRERTVRSGADVFCADCVVTTVPWTSVGELAGFSSETAAALPRLRHSSVEIRYAPDDLHTKAHWIYFPDDAIPYHRILVRSNFCAGSRGYWMETRSERVRYTNDNPHFMNDYAYPLNTIDKPGVMQNILRETHESGVYPLGRWGEHMHYNSDVTVDRAMRLAQELLR